MEIKSAGVGVVFDMDGVLVDSAPAHFQSWQILAREIGTTVTHKQFAHSFGRHNRDIVPMFFGPLPEARLVELLQPQRRDLSGTGAGVPAGHGRSGGVNPRSGEVGCGAGRGIVGAAGQYQFDPFVHGGGGYHTGDRERGRCDSREARSGSFCHGGGALAFVAAGMRGGSRMLPLACRRRGPPERGSLPCSPRIHRRPSSRAAVLCRIASSLDWRTCPQGN